jgi:uncharacterized membrane protein
LREFAQWLQATSLSETIQSISWLIPLVQSIHIVTIGVVFVSSLMIALRVLGRMRADEPFAEVWNRFAPWMWIGLAVMAVTGLTLVVGEPLREFTAISFWVKMTLIVVGVTGTALLGRSRSGEFSGGARAGAAGLVVLWLAIIFFGRAIAYDVEVWGSLAQ